MPEDVLFVIRITSAKTMAISPHAMSPLDKDGAVVLDSRCGSMFTLNLVGATIWKEISIGTCRNDILSVLTRDFDISEEQATADFEAFFDKLCKHQLIYDYDGGSRWSAACVDYADEELSSTSTTGPQDRLTVFRNYDTRAVWGKVSLDATKTFLERAAEFLEAFAYLLECEWILLCGFRVLQKHLRNRDRRHEKSGTIDDVARLNQTVTKACTYYPKAAACLQRSLTLLWMLWRRGLPAELVIGIRRFPFESHAWVEFQGQVVNDSQGVKRAYVTLQRFGNPA